MKGTSITFNGVLIVAYDLDEGEKIPWHEHPKPHGHLVLRGKTKVEIVGREPFEMKLHTPNEEMPANTLHQITALENGTVCIHISLGDPNVK